MKFSITNKTNLSSTRGAHISSTTMMIKINARLKFIHFYEKIRMVRALDTNHRKNHQKQNHEFYFYNSHILFCGRVWHLIKNWKFRTRNRKQAKIEKKKNLSSPATNDRQTDGLRWYSVCSKFICFVYYLRFSRFWFNLFFFSFVFFSSSSF